MALHPRLRLAPASDCRGDGAVDNHSYSSVLLIESYATRTNLSPTFTPHLTQCNTLIRRDRLTSCSGDTPDNPTHTRTRSPVELQERHPATPRIPPFVSTAIPSTIPRLQRLSPLPVGAQVGHGVNPQKSGIFGPKHTRFVAERKTR